MKRVLFSLVWLFAATISYAQSTIKGEVKDNQTLLPISGATIRFGDNSQTIADDNGVFDITISGTTKVTISEIGYVSQTIYVKDNGKPILILMTPANYNLNDVQVNTWATDKKDNQLNEAQSISVLTQKDLNRGNGLFPENQMNTIPGVFMQTRGISGGQRIIIRGYGNNTNFNGLGYQVYLNGIPLTDATGLTILDDVDFSNLGKVEVIKGPASSLYGSGIAGIVNLYTIQPKPNSTTIEEDNTAGSYGLYRNNTRVETSGAHSAFLVNYGHQTSDGYRSHSASKKDYANFKGDFFVSDNQTITTYLSYARSYEELAGEVPDSILYNRITWSDPAYTNNNAHALIESFRAGVSDNAKLSSHFNTQTSVYTNSYTLDQASAAGLTSNAVINFGGRTGLVFDNNRSTFDVHGILGGQVEKTISFNKSYNLNSGTLTTMKGDLQNQATTYNAFTEWKFSIPSGFQLTAGGSLNFLEFNIRDMMSGLSGHKDQSGYKRFTPRFTPRVALLKMLGKNVSVYADLSTGYTPPSTKNVIIPELGETNKALKPETGIQYEVGSKGSFVNHRLSYQVALFDLNVNNKLVSQLMPASGSTPQYSFTTNVGKQQNLGAELSLSYLAIDSKDKEISILRPFITYTYSDFKYKDFKSDNNNNSSTIDFSNNKVAGVAPNFFNLGIDMEMKCGFYLYATYQYVDKVPYTFDNEHYAKAYRLLGAKIGYKKDIGKHLGLDASFGADNLLNNTYYTFLFLSSTLSSQTDPHFIPGAYNATYYGSLKLSYSF